MTKITHEKLRALPPLPAPGSFEPKANADGDADMQGALITSLLVLYPPIASIAVILAGVVYFGGGFGA